TGLPRGPGDGLRVVARAGGDDPRRPLGLAEGRELDDRPADLERAGPLEVLGLEGHLSPDEAGERLGAIQQGDARGADDRAAPPPTRPLDLSDRRHRRCRGSRTPWT